MKAIELKNAILNLAIQGKLVPQNETDEPASILLEKIVSERNQLIKDKKIKATTKPLEEISDDEKPFNIPSSWQWVRLNSLGKIISGYTPKTYIKDNWNNDGIAWITPADMKYVVGKYVSHGRRYIAKKCLLSSSIRLIPKDSLIFSSRAPIGYIAIAENELCTNQGFKSLVPVNTEIVPYLYYCLIALTPEIQSRASGTIKEISGTEFGKTIIPLPPLKEQKRIVGKIENILPLVEKYDRLEVELSLLNKNISSELRKSILQYAIEGKLVPQDDSDEPASVLLSKIAAEKQELIKAKKIKMAKPLPPIRDNEKPFDIPSSWRWVRLDDVSIFYTGNSINKTEKEKNYTNLTEGYSYIATKDIGFDNSIDYTNGVQIPFETDFKIARKNAVLLCIEGGSAGRKIGLLNQDVCFGNKLCAFHSILINEYYLYYFLQSRAFLSIFNSSKTGIIGAVSINTIKELIMPIPPIEEQKRIVESVQELLVLCRRF